MWCSAAAVEGDSYTSESPAFMQYLILVSCLTCRQFLICDHACVLSTLKHNYINNWAKHRGLVWHLAVFFFLLLPERRAKFIFPFTIFDWYFAKYATYTRHIHIELLYYTRRASPNMHVFWWINLGQFGGFGTLPKDTRTWKLEEWVPYV